MVAASTSHALASFVAVLALCAGACFDSDETYQPRAGTTTGEPDPTTTGAASSSTGFIDNTTGEPEFTCRDAVACMNACAVDLVINPTPEPDLGCLLDCVEDNLTVRETYNLLQLSNCVADVCEQQAACMPEGGDTDTDTDGGSGSGSGSSTGGGGGGDDGGLIDPCLQCIFTKLSDDDPQECQEFHEVCDAMDEE